MSTGDLDKLAEEARRRAKQSQTPINTGPMAPSVAPIVWQNDPRSKPAK